ncbi:Aspartokinase [Phlyctochytrium bullatum]|nr:Aspartokinase [Phlyctochytrium bullatum]
MSRLLFALLTLLALISVGLASPLQRVQQNVLDRRHYTADPDYGTKLPKTTTKLLTTTYANLDATSTSSTTTEATSTMTTIPMPSLPVQTVNTAANARVSNSAGCMESGSFLAAAALAALAVALDCRKRHKVVAIVEGFHMPVIGSTRARLTQTIQTALSTRNWSHSRHNVELAELERDHVQLLRRAVKECRYWDDAEKAILLNLHHVRELLNAVRIIGEIPARSSDMILSTGDRMATRIFAAALAGEGLKPAYIDASKAVDAHAYAAPASEEFYFDVAEQTVAAILAADREGQVPVVTGCFGPFPAHQSMLETHGPTYPTALATLVSSQLPNCRELWLLNHQVTAIHTADPRVVPHAPRLRVLTADEAGEMSLMGIGAHLIGSRDGMFTRVASSASLPALEAAASEADSGSGAESAAFHGSFTEGHDDVPMRILGIDAAERIATVPGGWDDPGEQGGTLVLPAKWSRRAIRQGSLPRTRGAKEWRVLVHRDEVAVFTVDARVHVRGEDEENPRRLQGLGELSGNADTLKLLPRVFAVIEKHRRLVCGVVTGLKTVSLVSVAQDPEVSGLGELEIAPSSIWNLEQELAGLDLVVGGASSAAFRGRGRGRRRSSLRSKSSHQVSKDQDEPVHHTKSRSSSSSSAGQSSPPMESLRRSKPDPKSHRRSDHQQPISAYPPHYSRLLADLSELGRATMHLDFALLTLIGGSRQADLALIGDVLSALRSAGVAVRMCSQVLGGGGISLAVEKAQVNLAVGLVHDVCFGEVYGKYSGSAGLGSDDSGVESGGMGR